jgi:phenylpyruvate tautomerase PptA (4-oxalocrotonate tautomerase family)
LPIVTVQQSPRDIELKRRLVVGITEAFVDAYGIAPENVIGAGDPLDGEHWLLAYESTIKGWLSAAESAIKADSFFGALLKRGTMRIHRVRRSPALRRRSRVRHCPTRTSRGTQRIEYPFRVNATSGSGGCVSAAGGRSAGMTNQALVRRARAAIVEPVPPTDAGCGRRGCSGPRAKIATFHRADGPGACR